MNAISVNKKNYLLDVRNDMYKLAMSFIKCILVLQFFKFFSLFSNSSHKKQVSRNEDTNAVFETRGHV